MNFTLSPQNSGAYPADAPSEFHVVVLYEDGDSGRRGKRISDTLLHEWGEWGCLRQLWSFDVLAIEEVAEAVTNAACEADVVILSVSGEHELPEHVQRWLEQWTWLIHERNPLLAAMFLKTNRPAAYRTHVFLQMLAGEKGLAYFPQGNFPAEAGSVFEHRVGHRPVVTMMPPHLFSADGANGRVEV